MSKETIDAFQPLTAAVMSAQNLFPRLDETRRRLVFLTTGHKDADKLAREVKALRVTINRYWKRAVLPRLKECASALGRSPSAYSEMTLFALVCNMAIERPGYTGWDWGMYPWILDWETDEEAPAYYDYPGMLFHEFTAYTLGWVKKSAAPVPSDE